MRIAPHEICFEELEVAQWHIFRSADLTLNLPMPGAFLSELRDASIPLQKLVASDWMWDIVVKDVWWQMGWAVRGRSSSRSILASKT